MSIGIAYNPCKNCKEMDKCSICELTYYRKGCIKFPNADVVEVVRCKDCKYWQDNNNGYPHEECRWGKDETPDSYDYCSYGERREE